MIPQHLLVHTASVEPYLGSGAYGDQYDAAVSVACYYEGRRQLVRGGDGSEAVSEGVFYANPDVDVPVGSRVSVAGRDTYALSVSKFDDGGLTGLAHIEVAVA